MDKILTQTELDAKKFAVLSYLHRENKDLNFIVIDERDKNKESNVLTIRSSFFNGVERFTRKIIEGEFQEYAALYIFNPTVGDFYTELELLNQKIQKDVENRIVG